MPPPEHRAPASRAGRGTPSGARVERDTPSDDRALRSGGGALPARPSIALTPAEGEVARQMQICNACRYCEGFCAVFPAMTRRLEFARADVHYLANLCHQCGACYHACQYAPPHEFAVDVPRAMAAARRQTYAEYAWPRAFGAAYRRNGLVLAVALAFGLAFFLAVGAMLNGTLLGGPRNADFYAVFPHALMGWLFGAAFAFAVVALGVGAARFWREVSPGAPTPGTRAAAAGEATRDALALTYLDGGHGDGCNEADDRFTLARKRFHHATFYGFLLCVASTSVATVYHYAFGRQAPYPLASLPVVLGTLGGIGLVVGPLGLLWLNVVRDRAVADAEQRVLDRGFTALLLLTSVSGLVLLAWRSTAAMPLLLAVHLGAVLALFATLPYGKFAHAVYRSAALLKHAIERRQPNPVQAGGE